MRVYLTGHLAIEGDGPILDQRRLPGRQGRLALAYLALQRRPVPRSELAEVLWPEALPESWDIALSALISKLRSALRTVGLGPRSLLTELGCHELRFPSGTWVDIGAAIESLHAAESAERAEDWRGMWAPAGVAYQITKHPFLPGEEAPWIEAQRHELLAIRTRATECLARVSAWNNEPMLAVAMAEELLALEPFRETAYQILMRAHMQAGNRAEALLAYDRCRRLLAAELGTDPSPETQTLHLRILTST